MNTVELASKVENFIKLTLTAARFRSPNNYTVSRLFLYAQVMQAHGKDGIITTGFFSRIVGDMKKTGIIGTAKGGEVIFLTDAYWKLSGGEAQMNEYRQQREKLAVEIIRHLEASARTREYFNTEEFTHDVPEVNQKKVSQKTVDTLLRSLCENRFIVLDFDGGYRLSDKTRVELLKDIESESKLVEGAATQNEEVSR